MIEYCNFSVHIKHQTVEDSIAKTQKFQKKIDIQPDSQKGQPLH